MLLQQRGRADRDQPLVKQFLRVHPWPSSGAKTDSGVYAGFNEVGKLHGCMDVYVDVWVLRREIRQSRKKPLRKEESERGHSQGPGAAVGTRLVDCTLQIGERLLNLRP